MTSTTTSSTTPPTTPSTPGRIDPRRLLDRAIATASDAIARVRPDQLDDPTPCSEMDVRTLLGHLVGVLDRIAALGRGDDPFAVDDAVAPDDRWSEVWTSAARRTSDAWSDDDVLQRPMALPWKQGTGADILVSYLNELTVHTWDLATATGQRPDWDDAVVRSAYEARDFLPAEDRLELYERIAAEMGLDDVPVPFAEAIVVAPDAAPIDQLVAWNGRDPVAWRLPRASELTETGPMEPIAALESANAEFARRLSQVTDEHWALPTPCSDWDVRALVNHVLLGTRMSIHVLSGMPRAEVISYLDDDMMAETTDPTATFDELARQMVAGFAGPGGMDGIVEHPGGDFPRSMFCGFRVADGACHAWDLARAIGVDDHLDADLVRFLWDDAQPQREMIAATGMFGDSASGTVGDDAPLQTRYLDLMGRRP